MSTLPELKFRDGGVFFEKNQIMNRCARYQFDGILQIIEALWKAQFLKHMSSLIFIKNGLEGMEKLFKLMEDGEFLWISDSYIKVVFRWMVWHRLSLLPRGVNLMGLLWFFEVLRNRQSPLFSTIENCVVVLLFVNLVGSRDILF